MARPALNNKWSENVHQHPAYRYIAWMADNNPYFGFNIPAELKPQKITNMTLYHGLVNGQKVKTVGVGFYFNGAQGVEGIVKTHDYGQYWEYYSGTGAYNNYETYFGDVSGLINTSTVGALGFTATPTATAQIFNAHFECYLDWDLNKDIIKGLAVIDGDPADGSIQLQMEFAQKTEANAIQYEKTYHVASIIGTNYETEAKGTTITFTGLIGPLPKDIQISIDLYRYTTSPDEYIFAPMQKNKVIPVTLNPTYPVILSLDPDDFDVNIEQPVKVQWASENQESFKLSIKDTTFTGQKETQVLVPASNFNKGLNTIKLELSNASPIKATKTATFRGYGKPTLPIFDNKNIYNTSKPKIKWTTDEQHIYQFQIFKGIEKIYDTGEVIASAQEHQVTEILQNETTYTVKVRVKNDKGLWSDLAQKDIEISYVALEPATLTLFETNSQIVVNVSNPENEAFAKCEVYRKTAYTPWRRIAKNAPIQTSFADSLIASNTEYSYKVISYDKQGGATESDIKTAEITLKTSSFIDLDTMTEIAIKYDPTPEPPFTVTPVQDKTVTKYEGMRAPVTEVGETNYHILNFNKIFRNYQEFKKAEADCDKAQVIIFRSPQGHLFYGQVTAWGDQTLNAANLLTVPFTFTEVNFIESEIYDGGMTLRIIRLDAGYKLDAGYELDGYYNE